MPRTVLLPELDARLTELSTRLASEIWTLFLESANAAVASAAARMFGASAPSRAGTSARPATGSHRATTKSKRTGKGKNSLARINELKRLGATRPVACPSPGCANPGVRRFSSFCPDHYASLSSAEMKRLRAAQRAARA